MSIVISNLGRQNLLAMRQTTNILGIVQKRLATGKKVNSALDNPASFFTASAMMDRSSQLGGLIDGISLATNTIKSSDSALGSISKLVEQAKATAREALQDETEKPKEALAFGIGEKVQFTITLEGTSTKSDGLERASFVKVMNDKLGDYLTTDLGKNGQLTITPTKEGTISLDRETIKKNQDAKIPSMNFYLIIDEKKQLAVNIISNEIIFDNLDSIVKNTPSDNSVRTKLAAQYNETLEQISALADDADYNGINLLRGDDLDVAFNEKTGSKKNELHLKGFDASYQGLGLSKTTSHFQSDTEIEESLAQLTKAAQSIAERSTKLGSQLTIVKTRQSFNNQMMELLQQSASDLTLADTNKEGANLLALQTRQKLATTTMGLTTQTDRSILSFL